MRFHDEISVGSTPHPATVTQDCYIFSRKSINIHLPLLVGGVDFKTSRFIQFFLQSTCFPQSFVNCFGGIQVIELGLAEKSAPNGAAKMWISHLLDIKMCVCVCSRVFGLLVCILYTSYISVLSGKPMVFSEACQKNQRSKNGPEMRMTKRYRFQLPMP